LLIQILSNPWYTHPFVWVKNPFYIALCITQRTWQVIRTVMLKNTVENGAISSKPWKICDTFRTKL